LTHKYGPIARNHHRRRRGHWRRVTSAIGPQLTCRAQTEEDRLWPVADSQSRTGHVRFRGQSGHRLPRDRVYDYAPQRIRARTDACCVEWIQSGTGRFEPARGTRCGARGYRSRGYRYGVAVGARPVTRAATMASCACFARRVNISSKPNFRFSVISPGRFNGFAKHLSH
jgi:hypothetical protein